MITYLIAIFMTIAVSSWSFIVIEIIWYLMGHDVNHQMLMISILIFVFAIFGLFTVGMLSVWGMAIYGQLG